MSRSFPGNSSGCAGSEAEQHAATDASAAMTHPSRRTHPLAAAALTRRCYLVRAAAAVVYPVDVPVTCSKGLPIEQQQDHANSTTITPPNHTITSQPRPYIATARIAPARPPAPSAPPSVKCRCKKDKCLKLYCRCFELNAYCSHSCHCQQVCRNTPEWPQTRIDAMRNIQLRKITAFNDELSKSSDRHGVLADAKCHPIYRYNEWVHVADARNTNLTFIDDGSSLNYPSLEEGLQNHGPVDPLHQPTPGAFRGRRLPTWLKRVIRYLANLTLPHLLIKLWSLRRKFKWTSSPVQPFPRNGTSDCDTEASNNQGDDNNDNNAANDENNDADDVGWCETVAAVSVLLSYSLPGIARTNPWFTEKRVIVISFALNFIGYVFTVAHQKNERADDQEERDADRNRIAAVEERAAGLEDEMKRLRTSNITCTLSPHTGTPSKGMSSRVFRQARKKKENAETSDADKKHLLKMMYDCSNKSGPAYSISTMLCLDASSEKVTETILDLEKFGDGGNEYT